MHLRVGGIVELLGYKGLPLLCRDLFRAAHGAFHPLRARGQHDLGTQCRHQRAALNAHCLRHGQDQLVAFGCRDKGEADAGVAAGRFHDDGILIKQALLFRVLDHRKGDSVLDTSKGVKVLQLGNQVGGRVFLFRKFVQLQQGGPADEVC
ncbi:hypothetical protein SDC9_111106 [bioreactor metagenome]|uniref:Uncharacterized protein n=1 Tax=bioreactor metagenome TaxID=1076179 RepID=A0A645BFK2_9ZZZZ